MEKIGRYEIREELGRGGMATVYKAYDPRFERLVAVKVLPPAFLHDPQFRARFEREARIIAALEHPAIVPVYDYGEDQGQLYLIMRLMTGGSLVERIAKGPLSLSEAAEILTRLAPAMDTAHQRGIIHRDLKPGNILFDEWNQPYLSDFGIAKLAESATALTASGGMVGTPAYMSPEQVQAVDELDGRSDIYALGVILYEMLSGELPYKANTPMGLALKHVTDPVPRILDTMTDLPTQVQWVIEQAMAKERRSRYQTTAALAAAAKASLTGSLVQLSKPVDGRNRMDAQQTADTQYYTTPLPAGPEQATLSEIEEQPLHSSSPAGVVQPAPPKPARQSRLPMGLAFLSGIVVLVLCGGGMLVNLFQSGLGAPPGGDSEVAALTESASEEIAAVATPTHEQTETAEPIGTAVGAAPPTSQSDNAPPVTAEESEAESAEEPFFVVESDLGQAIIERGVIRIGIRGESFWPFNVVESDGVNTGFEIELIEEVVARLFGDYSVEIEWIPVTAAERFAMLQSGEIDLLMRLTTHTTGREEFGEWSANYFLDGQRFMVRENSGLSQIEDLDGAAICVFSGTTTEANLELYFGDNGLTYTAVTFDNLDVMWNAFRSGQCAAVTSDWSTLLFMSGDDPAYTVIGPVISSEPLAIGVPPGNVDFRDEVDQVLIVIIEDGTWSELYESWFPEPHPWSLDEMLNEPPPNR